MDKREQAFREYLRSLINAEQQRLGLETGTMISLLQSHIALPDFYRQPAEAAAEAIVADSPTDLLLRDTLHDTIKAVYGAWIRESYRNI